MKTSYLALSHKEPYRLFFPLGIILLLWGALVWLPQLWNPGDYPVLVHRYLMLNGFVASFIGGFLMTAVPKFSRTMSARWFEIISYFTLIVLGLLFAYLDKGSLISLISSLQAVTLLFFLFSRILKRQENPPYSFVFIFVGLGLWFISGVLGIFIESDIIKQLHYEGAIASIILGVGSRLIPGILGHVEIVTAQRKLYERPGSILATVPPFFFLLILSFVGSYFLPFTIGSGIRALVVSVIGMKFWKLGKLPKERTALTLNIWLSGWLIVLSFILVAFWQEGMIHAGHSFFISGIVLLSLLIGTRVLQSHGPKLKSLEDSKLLYGVSFFVILAAATRVTAFLMPEDYLSHLSYSSAVLVTGVLLWSWKYLRYVTYS